MRITMDYVEYIKHFPLKTFQKSELLLQKGDHAEYFIAIREGFVKITSINDTGTERLLWVAGRYDITPMEQLFSSRSNIRYFYTALTDGSFYAINKKDFMEKAKTTPLLMEQVAKGMASHYDDLLDHIDAVDASTVKERLMRILSYLAKRFSGDEEVDLYEEGLTLTHQDLASMIGSTRETTSLTLSQLRTEKLIDYDRLKFVVYVDKIEEKLETV